MKINMVAFYPLAKYEGTEGFLASCTVFIDGLGFYIRDIRVVKKNGKINVLIAPKKGIFRGKSCQYETITFPDATQNNRFKYEIGQCVREFVRNNKDRITYPFTLRPGELMGERRVTAETQVVVRPLKGEKKPEKEAEPVPVTPGKARAKSKFAK